MKLKTKIIDQKELTKFMRKHPNAQSVAPDGGKVIVKYYKSNK